MRSGKLDREITIERHTVTGDDGYGNPAMTWTAVATLRAQIVQASIEEFMRNWGAASETAIVFRTRYLDGVKLSDRVVCEGENHDIKELKEIGRRRGLEIRTARSG